MRARSARGTRAMVLFAVFAIVPLVLLVVIPLRLATSALDDGVTARVAETSAASADAVAQQLHGLAGLVTTMAGRPELTDASSLPMADENNPVRSTLRRFQQANANVRYTTMLTADGRITAVEPWLPQAVGADYSFRDYYKGAIVANGPYVSQAYLGSTEERPKLIAVSQAIRGTSVNGQLGPVQAVVLVVIDVAQSFQPYVDSFQTGHNVGLTIFDQRGQVVARPGMGRDIASIDNPHLQMAMSGSTWSGKEEARAGSPAMVTSYVPVSDTGWVVAASVPMSTATSAVVDLRGRVLVIGGALGGVMLAGFVTLLRTLRAREKAEQSRLSVEARNRQVLETAAQAFIETTRDGTITEWNHHAQEVFGWTRDEIVGKRLQETVVPVSRRLNFDRVTGELFSDAPDSPERVRIEGLVLRKGDHRPFQVEMTLWTTTVDGDTHLNAFISDISERKRLEEERELIFKRQRRLVDELREADKTKSDFVSTVSHELRTPLTSITGYLEMLRDGYGGPLNEQQVSMLEVVDRNSTRLLGLIEDLLTLSRIESGSLRSDLVTVDVASLVIGVQQAMIPAAIEKQLVLDADVASDAGKVLGDPGQLEQVLLNVVSNAIKFTPGGGRVSIDAYRSGETVHLMVSDTGIGIPVEEQHRLFSRFFRASTAQDRAIQGTGLGLTIVKGIVDRHNGRISVQSAEGVGTTVLVELPAVVPVASSNVASSNVASSGGLPTEIRADTPAGRPVGSDLGTSS